MTRPHAAVGILPVSEAIPFRAEDGALANHSVTALGVAVVLLAMAWAAGFVAKRRGWLARWLPATDAAPSTSRLVLAGRFRLSQKTVVYEVVTTGQARVLVAESPSGVQMVVLPRGDEVVA